VTLDCFVALLLAMTAKSDLNSSSAKKKAAWFPGRPFLSHGSTTLTGDFGHLRRGPISWLCPARVPLQIGAVANCCPNRRGGFPPP
jgi:hypothetical protein